MEESLSVAEQEWSSEFHGVNYIINMTVSELMLTLELENAETSERWSGEFTAQYIEEISHKAGNLKKFSVFAKMLSSSFSKDNESVFVDILTFTDLELLKARKTGAKQQPASLQAGRQYQKRYVILTYSAEFDRVHYPLPLGFEETPNVPALRRNIARLRRQLQDKSDQALLPASDKEKELRQSMSQLRQDNTELRHRLRHGGQANAPSTQSSTMNTELANTNARLRKQVESLKKEVGESAQALERLRLESAKEVAKWKMRIGAPAPRSPHSVGEAAAVSDLRRRLAETEKDLRYERLLNTGARRSSSAGRTQGRGDSPRWASTSARSGVRSGVVGSGSVGGGVDRRYRSPGSYQSPAVGHTPSYSQSRDRPASAGVSGRAPRSSSPSTYGQRFTDAGSRESSPALRPRTPSSANNANGLSSSLGGRFDPTAYQREKAERERRAKGGRAWGAGAGEGSGGKHRYASPSAGESGYASANSQSSAGSRASKRSQRSDGSQSQSRGEPPRRKSKKGKKGVSGAKGKADVTSQMLDDVRGRVSDSETDESERAGPRSYRPQERSRGSEGGGIGSGIGIGGGGGGGGGGGVRRSRELELQQQAVAAAASVTSAVAAVAAASSAASGLKYNSDQHLQALAQERSARLLREEPGIASRSLTGSVRSSRESLDENMVNARSEPWRQGKQGGREKVEKVEAKVVAEIRSLSSSVTSLRSQPPTVAGATADHDISEIDQRIQALQNYLDNARNGILAAENN